MKLFKRETIKTNAEIVKALEFALDTMKKRKGEQLVRNVEFTQQVGDSAIKIVIEAK